MYNLHEQLNKVMPLAAIWNHKPVRIYRDGKMIKTVRLLKGDFISFQGSELIDINDENAEAWNLIEDLQGNVPGTILNLILKNKGFNTILKL